MVAVDGIIVAVVWFAKNAYVGPTESLTDLQSTPSTSSPDTHTRQNVGLIALRSAGCNHVDMEHIVQSNYSQVFCGSWAGRFV